jgi:hypothetical protein
MESEIQDGVESLNGHRVQDWPKFSRQVLSHRAVRQAAKARQVVNRPLLH